MIDAARVTEAAKKRLEEVEGLKFYGITEVPIDTRITALEVVIKQSEMIEQLQSEKSKMTLDLARETMKVNLFSMYERGRFDERLSRY
ncbi:hypothetical protein EEL32_22510 [Brevibacillus laterosporus]|nr:hypothetical protein [Brevibacillus laterosporus]TPG77704.1 hypothetical protein EEL32_22510 [Brevibacillus laterosporus]